MPNKECQHVGNFLSETYYQWSFSSLGSCWCKAMLEWIVCTLIASLPFEETGILFLLRTLQKLCSCRIPCCQRLSLKSPIDGASTKGENKSCNWVATTKVISVRCINESGKDWTIDINWFCESVVIWNIIPLQRFKVWMLQRRDLTKSHPPIDGTAQILSDTFQQPIIIRRWCTIECQKRRCGISNVGTTSDVSIDKFSEKSLIQLSNRFLQDKMFNTSFRWSHLLIHWFDTVMRKGINGLTRFHTCLLFWLVNTVGPNIGIHLWRWIFHSIATVLYTGFNFRGWISSQG